MITWIQRLVFFFFQKYVGGRMLGGARRQGLLIYFKAVNGVRKLLTMVAVLAVVLQLMTLGLVGTLVTLAWIFVHDETTRLYVLCGGFATLFVVPLVAGCLMLSERFWLRLSGAGSLIDERSSV